MAVSVCSSAQLRRAVPGMVSADGLGMGVFVSINRPVELIARLDFYLELPDAVEHIKFEVLVETERRRKDAEARQKVVEAAARSATSELESLQRFRAKQEQKRKKAMKPNVQFRGATKKPKRK